MSQEMVHRVILSTKKEVMLKEMKIKYQNLAIQAVGKRGGDNQLLVGSLMQDELLKILLVQIDGKPVDKKLVENLDSLFTYQEYAQVMKVVQQIAGGDDVGEYQTEIVPIGKE